MNSNEDYLDNLLKSMSDSEKKPEKDSNAIMTPEDIEAMFAIAEKVAGGESMPSESVKDHTTDNQNDGDTNFASNHETSETSESRESSEPSESTESCELTESTEFSDKPTEGIPNHTVESTMDMSVDDIVKLLEESEHNSVQNGTNQNEIGNENDLDTLLQKLDMDKELSEISELLKTADNNEALPDMSNEDSNPIDEIDISMESPENEQNQSIEKQDIQQKKQKEKKIKRENKKKQERKKEQGNDEINEFNELNEFNDINEINEHLENHVKREKKQGFLGKLLSVLTTEDDTDEKTISENQSIMEELENEDRKEANKKKKIKKGKMLGNVSSSKDTEEDADIKKNQNKKVKKPKKVASPKKEKLQKKVIKEETFEKPSKKISKRSIFVVLLFSVSVFAALLFGIYIGSTMIQKSSAVKAFENQDYITCYEQLYGMKLTEKQTNMFHHAEVVLKMQRRIDMYESYINEDKELEALDSLMQAIDNYDEIYTKAQSCGATDEVAVLYGKVLGILKEQYNLTEEDARVIVDCTSNVEYTRYLTALIGGENVSSDDNTGGIVIPKQEMADVLPAEEELIEPNFAD